MYNSRAIAWFTMERSSHDRDSYELQGVGIIVIHILTALLTPFCSLIELIVLNVGLQAGILDTVIVSPPWAFFELNFLLISVFSPCLCWKQWFSHS